MEEEVEEEQEVEEEEKEKEEVDEEKEEEVESSELSADDQEGKALDVSSSFSAEQEVSIPALLAVIKRKVPETSQSQEEEVCPHSILSLLVWVETEISVLWEGLTDISI